MKINDKDPLNNQDFAMEETPESTQPQGAAEASGEAALARDEAAEWRDKYVRTLAEFDNYRKRTRTEMDALRGYVAEGLLLSLLNVYDDLNRTLETVNTDEVSLRRGVELIQQKFRNYLEAQKITKLECRGKEFNPDEHDAILLQPRAGFPANVVLEEVSPGYKLGDRVIRHAQVIVSAEVAGGEAEGEQA